MLRISETKIIPKRRVIAIMDYQGFLGSPDNDVHRQKVKTLSYFENIKNVKAIIVCLDGTILPSPVSFNTLLKRLSEKLVKNEG